MKVENITAHELKSGNILIFGTKDKNDYREAELMYRYNKYYLIWFNGTLIAAYKTFPAYLKRVNKLHTNWNLEYIRNEKK